jgi:hypothetical protein
MSGRDELVRTNHDLQPGDPAKAAAAIIAALDAEDPPLRLVLGADAIGNVERPPEPARKRARDLAIARKRPPPSTPPEGLPREYLVSGLPRGRHAVAWKRPCARAGRAIDVVRTPITRPGL